ncbi:EAL domain-containing protein [Geodermatophilus sp. DSM 44513]|uniref:putative bifunctional diguanylate cyclase/phosphodiesterase n=1 Tax=Geodermatophilus sp. DSM 44513 TaxID=1528104 RepID=UPI001412ED99|nr:EAL domain-containing protein [Geodermatophilus sp. DSM 44513]WNV75848.1 EAL domain-containing protein [Geodermatophilus sp. DSM 44513]
MVRVLTSWRGLALLLVVAVAGLAGTATVLERRQSDTALQQVVDRAEVITELLVEAELTRGSARPALSPPSTQRIDRGVRSLVRSSRLTGLQLWTPKGQLLYSDAALADPLSGDDLARLVPVLAGSPQVTFELDEDRGTPTATVLVQPRDAEGRPSGVVAEVLLPQDDLVARLDSATRNVHVGGVTLLVVVVAVGVVTRQRLLRREHEARHDPLTGLGNRTLLRQEALTVLDPPRRARAASGPLTALLLLDLDGFKTVNDTLGHAVGDLLLVEVAGALRAAVRPTDVVTRLGGDEFAVLLRDLGSDAAAERVAGQVARALHRPFTVGEVTLEVGVSVGLALSPDHGTTLVDLLRRADVAMYQAKRDGGGVRRYDPVTDPHDQDQLDLLAQLRTAIDTDQLRLHFQPVVALRTGRPVRLEALVRWQHPERGLLLPAAFLPQAERTALMPPLTDWVLREALRRCAGWRAAGADVGVAVNVTPGTLLETDLAARLGELLAAEGLPGSALEVEVTETAMTVDPERAAATLRALRAMGICVAVDDFGAGYTSLWLLKTLPVDRLKIDRGFVTHLLDSPADEAVTRSVVQLGHDLGLVVVAEGVETAEVRRRLVELGCDEAQGHLIARPMEAAAVLPWLAGSTAPAGLALT